MIGVRAGDPGHDRRGGRATAAVAVACVALITLAGLAGVAPAKKKSSTSDPANDTSAGPECDILKATAAKLGKRKLKHTVTTAGPQTLPAEDTLVEIRVSSSKNGTSGPGGKNIHPVFGFNAKLKDEGRKVVYKFSRRALFKADFAFPGLPQTKKGKKRYFWQAVACPFAGSAGNQPDGAPDFGQPGKKQKL